MNEADMSPSDDEPEGINRNEWAKESPHLANQPRRALSDYLMACLDRVKDEGTHVDTGGGMGARDFWVRVDGITYFLSVCKSGANR